jgi:hypothetical protein
VCVFATGPSTDIGAVNATTIALFQPTNGSCTGGFGGRGGAGRPSGGTNG